METGSKWYVVRAISGKENKIKEYIEVEIANANLGHIIPQVLVPTEKVYQIRKGKKISKDRNFFPGYILLEVKGKLDGEVITLIKNVNGVIGFLGTEKGKQPVPLLKHEVNRLLGKVDELSEQDEEINEPFLVGETVKVTDGPFNNFNGVIEEVNEDKKKLKVMIKIFGRKTPVELNYLQVEKE